MGKGGGRDGQGDCGKNHCAKERFEAGISLAGTEVKSIRAGKVNLKDCFCTVEDGQLVVIGMHISPYEQGNIFNKDPLRKRVLLMHKKEIMRLFGKVKQEGMAIVPLSLYWKGPHVKVELGLCRGKRQHDKREAMAKRDAHREMDRAMKQANARRSEKAGPPRARPGEGECAGTGSRSDAAKRKATRPLTGKTHGGAMVSTGVLKREKQAELRGLAKHRNL